MTKQCCHTCLYSYCSLRMRLNGMGPGCFPARPLCANHPDSPGHMREVFPGNVCRNYRPKPAEPAGDIKRIPVGDGQYVLVDAADHEWLSRWTWHLTDGYAARWKGSKRIYMHREIARPPEGMIVDHINRNRMDNCRANLRVCTHQENMYNKAKRAGSCSRFKGVGYRKNRGQWFAEVRFEGKPIWLGFFDDEVEAARAYDRKAVEFFGEFAHLNFPEEWPPERRQKVYADAQPLRDALKAKAGKAKAEKGKGKKAKRPNATARGKTLRRKGRKRSLQDAKRTTKRSPQRT